MYEDSLTISLLPALDAATHPDVWLFPSMESTANDCGVLTEDVKTFTKGSWNKYLVEVKIGAVGNKVFFEFGLNSSKDNGYGRFSPLDETSYQCNRNNTIDDLRKFIVNDFEHSVLARDNNLCRQSKKELLKICKELVKEIA